MVADFKSESPAGFIGICRDGVRRREERRRSSKLDETCRNQSPEHDNREIKDQDKGGDSSFGHQRNVAGKNRKHERHSI